MTLTSLEMIVTSLEIIVTNLEMFRAFLIKLEDEDFQLFLSIKGKMRPFY